MLDAAMHNSHITVNCANMENSEAGPTFGLQVKAKPVICSIKYPGGWLHGDDVHQVSISLLCVGTHDQLESDCPKEGVQATVFSTSGRIEMTIDSKRRDPFELTKFGSPFSDNTVLDHGHRISLLLRSVLPDDTAKPGVEPRANAQLEMVAFPEDLVPPGYQPTITNISRLLGGESG